MNSNRQTLIFLHGWSNNPEYFNFISNLLSKSYKVLTPVMPGFGENKITHPYTLEDYSSWLKNYLDNGHIKNPVLIGHSFGGAVAVYYLNRFPNPKIKLVLVDAAVIRKSQTIRNRLISRLVKLIKPIIVRLNLKLIFLKLTNLEGSDYQQITNPLMKKTFQEIIYKDLTKEARQIKNKVLLIWGENDKKTPIIQGQKLKDLIPNSCLTVINEAGHFPFIDQPYNFLSVLSDFLK